MTGHAQVDEDGIMIVEGYENVFGAASYVGYCLVLEGFEFRVDN